MPSQAAQLVRYGLCQTCRYRRRQRPMRGLLGNNFSLCDEEQSCARRSCRA